MPFSPGRNWQNWGRGQSVGFRVFPYTEGAVPWRFSFFVEPQMHKPIIDACLAAGVPISDWYPSVAPMFGDAGQELLNRLRNFISSVKHIDDTTTA